MKRILSLFLVLLLMSCDSLPTKIDFEDWLATQYLKETKNYAHHIYIISWEKTEDSVRKDTKTLFFRPAAPLNHVF